MGDDGVERIASFKYMLVAGAIEVVADAAPGRWRCAADFPAVLFPVYDQGAASITSPFRSRAVAQPLWEMTGGLLAMDIRTGEG
jgi:hypothetical protein